MKVIVTGAEGFVGKNLCLRLATMDGIDLVKFDAGDSFSLLEENISDADYIFHLAGVNRPKSADEFYSGNADLTKDIVSLIQKSGAKPIFVLASSIQAALENDYGKSKKLAEEAARSLAPNSKVYIYRLHNVFGKWCRPNYNSVVATFCHNTMRDIPLEISDEKRVMQLVYIDDVIDEFVSLLTGNAPREPEVRPVYEITLGELAEKLRGFKNAIQGIAIPEMGDAFTKKLFSTFVSYAEEGDALYVPTAHGDARGLFAELLKTENAGQMSVAITKKGEVRGNHFHDTKLEKFIVVAGEAKISLRSVATNEKMEFEVSGENLKSITIPPGWTHNIKNIGDSDMVVLIWANEAFDAANPDTFFEEV